ncbi:MAG: hypothetical protein ACOCXA_05370, partial [Planctomycetota bacterium]
MPLCRSKPILILLCSLTLPLRAEELIAPVMETAPSLSGQTYNGELLTCDPGSWSDPGGGTVSFTYEWRKLGEIAETLLSPQLRDGGASILLDEQTVGFWMQCTVTATASSNLSTSTATVATLNWDPGTVQVNGLGLPATLYLALEDLYQATDGGNWTDNSAWGDPTASSWFGLDITVSSGETSATLLVDLSLPGNGLVGGLPTDFQLWADSSTTDPVSGNALAAGFHRIDLSDNDLAVRELPTDWNGFSYLDSLDLARCGLSGSVPMSLFYDTRALVDLSGNLLAGTMPDISLQEGQWPTQLAISYNAIDTSTAPDIETQGYSAPNTSTQTLPPTGLSYDPETAILSWQPMAYIADPGFYELAAVPSGSSNAPVFAHQTDSKSASSFNLTRLTDISY